MHFTCNALVANRMNLGPGGKQPQMCNRTMRDGTIQSMVQSDGVPKGMKVVLEAISDIFKAMNIFVNKNLTHGGYNSTLCEIACHLLSLDFTTLRATVCFANFLSIRGTALRFPPCTSPRIGGV